MNNTKNNCANCFFGSGRALAALDNGKESAK